MTLSFRIRKTYFGAIKNGQKTIEYRRDSEYWRRRIENLVFKDVLERVPNREAWMPYSDELLEAVFICGKDTVKKRIIYIERIKTPETFSEQGKLDVDTPTCLAFHLALYGSKTQKT